MVGERIRTIPGFPKGTANELKHCILAHHGELEYGSPKKPALAEALALSFADNIDAKMETIREIFASVPENNLEWQGYEPSAGEQYPQIGKRIIGISQDMKKNDSIELKIEDMGVDGEGIGKYEGMTFFVKDAVIGDTIRAASRSLRRTTLCQSAGDFRAVALPCEAGMSAVCALRRLPDPGDGL